MPLGGCEPLAGLDGAPAGQLRAHAGWGGRRCGEPPSAARAPRARAAPFPGARESRGDAGACSTCGREEPGGGVAASLRNDKRTLDVRPALNLEGPRKGDTPCSLCRALPPVGLLYCCRRRGTSAHARCGRRPHPRRSPPGTPAGLLQFSSVLTLGTRVASDPTGDGLGPTWHPFPPAGTCHERRLSPVLGTNQL